MPYSPGQQHDREEQKVENGEGKEGLGGRQVTSDDGECGEGAHCETAAIKRMEAELRGGEKTGEWGDMGKAAHDTSECTRGVHSPDNTTGFKLIWGKGRGHTARTDHIDTRCTQHPTQQGDHYKQQEQVEVY
jgi:hypothetical protein